MSNAAQKFRLVALAEGISYLVLLLIAMPLKYAMDMPMPVKVVGWIHGVLFIAYVVLLALAARQEGWSLKFVAIAFVASLIPAGTFWLDGQLARPTPK